MNIFIFGKNGMLGNTISLYLNKYFNLISFDRNDYDILNSDLNSLMNLLKNNNIKENDYIINAIGLIPTKSKNSINFFNINSLFPKILGYISIIFNCKVIHISTNGVFSNNNKINNENIIPNTNDLYGISKLLGETNDICIIRCSILGEEKNSADSLLSWVLSQNNSTIKGYTNHYFNGVTCLQLAKHLEYIIQNNIYWHGVRHIYSNEVLSKYHLISNIIDIYKLNIILNKCESNIMDNRILSSIYKPIMQTPSLYEGIDEQRMFYIKNRANIGTYTVLKSCRFCKKNVYPLFNFEGLHPLAGGFLTKDEFTKEVLFPLSISYCKDCCIFQCDQFVDTNLLFKKNYFYYSSMIPFLVKHFSEYAKLIKEKYYDNNSVKTILEIGCNDGVMLRKLKEHGFNVIGVDPSHTVKQLIEDGYNIYNDYFNESLSNKIILEHGKVDIFLSSNSFAHIHDMDTIIKGIKNVLKDGGLAIIEVHNSDNIIKNLHFDFIYHEHMTYYTKLSFHKIFELHNMYVERIDDIDVHGGSIRVYIRNNNISYKNTIVNDTDNFEKQLIDFKKNLFTWKNSILKLYYELKSKGKKIYGYGASGRTNIILSFLNIDVDEIVDDAQSKIGSYMPITHKLIHSSEYIYENPPDYIILLSWPYKDNILQKHKKFTENGGKFIIPLSEISLV
jgi:dTDP-4-dehydrorhamnose reductase/SAM-dependent methyltransferase